MIRINGNYKKLQASYLFITIAQKVKDFQQKNPNSEIIKLGIGDVTLPLPKACIKALHKAVDEMGEDASFKGYGPEQGYDFLRNAIAEHDFKPRGVEISPDEIFVSDGSKCDTGNIQEIFAGDIAVAVPDPVYPVYLDTNVMAGRTGNPKDGRYDGILYLESTAENNYIPNPPKAKADLLYLCFPNNPTGAVATKEQLTAWVEYARKNRSLILFDAAYVEYIQDGSLPQSIYEIEGAKEVAIEFRSFSKTAGFTGLRCAYIVIPDECRAFTGGGELEQVQPLWSRRHSTKFNGVAYPVQRAAEAVFSAEGKQETDERIAYYLENAKIIREEMTGLGYQCTGGIHSPYIWVNTGMESWKFFEHLLYKAGVVTTPGTGFGKCGEGHIRISAFNHREQVEKAMQNIVVALK